MNFTEQPTIMAVSIKGIQVELSSLRSQLEYWNIGIMGYGKMEQWVNLSWKRCRIDKIPLDR